VSSGKGESSSGQRGEFEREGASPPLIFFPPLEQNNIRFSIMNLFERGTKGVRTDKTDPMQIYP
jgi:hypothetical protein